MARKQARRRKQKKAEKFTWPKLRLRRFVMPLAAVAAVFATYHMSLALLDREITAVEISGPFARVSALQIEEAISDEIDLGFVGADLDRIRERIVALPWIDQARVARRWPSRLSIAVSEQVPAAVWGDDGLLNTRGELFVTGLTRIPPELPKLSGPEARVADVAGQYLAIREQLIPAGLDLTSVDLDARGAWRMTLANGIEIRIGRRDVAARTKLFLDVVADIVASRSDDIRYVDMRYGNGFTIGWHGGDETPVTDPESAGDSLLAATGNN